MELIRLVLFSLVLVSILYWVYAAYCTWVFFKIDQSSADQDLAWPPISVIKPVAEEEEGCRENFLSFCFQDYPDYELIFTFPRKSHSLIPLIEELNALFPLRRISWVAVDPERGPNYKVGNLIPAVQKARYPVLVISDSDMRVGPQYLKQTVSGLLQEGIGLVTSLYRNVNLGNVFAALQALTVQTTFVPNVLFSRRMEGVSYAFGATLCIDKALLAELGGAEALLGYLADDYQLGHRVHEKHYRIHLSKGLIDQVSHIETLRQHFHQQLRAAITQRVCRPLGYFASVITHQVSLSLLFLMVDGFSLWSWALLAAGSGIRVLSAMLLNRTAIRNLEVGRYLWLIPINDLLNSIVWLFSLFINTVHWKERTFRVLKGGKMVELRRPKEW